MIESAGDATMTERNTRLDIVGIGLGTVFASWVLMVSVLVGGRPGPMAALGLGFVLAVIAGDRLGRLHPVAVPMLVSAAPVLALLLYRSYPAGANVLGYANASGALFFVAACGTVWVASSVTGVVTKTVAYLLAATWIFVPWNLGAHAAGVLAALVPLVLVLARRRKQIRAVLGAGAGVTLAGIATTATLGLVGYRPSQGANLFDQLFNQSLDELRVVLWGDAVNLIRQHPITGIGPGNFGEISPTAQARDDALWAHNEYLEIAAEVGLPGALLLLALVGWAFTRLWPATANHRPVPAIAALAGVCLHANVDYVWHFPAVLVALGLMVGAGSVVSEKLASREAVPLRAPARVLAVSSLALWLLLLAPIEPMNPVATVTNGAAWEDDVPGVQFVAPGMIRSLDSPSEVLRRIVETGAFTVEVRAAPATLGQEGPARIFSISDGIADRNLTLGQEGRDLVIRLRTTETNPNGLPQVAVPDVFTSTDLRHIVVSRNGDSLRVHVDGERYWSGAEPPGSLDNWNEDFPLILGNERTGDRPWLGEISLVALHERALTSEEIAGRHEMAAPSASSSNTSDPPPAALYTFEEMAGDRVPDRSAGELGPGLVIPQRIPAPQRGWMEALLDPGGDPAVRAVLHALLFGAWVAVLVLVPRPTLPIGKVTRIVLWGGGAIALVASVLRYLAGRSPSISDLVGAGLGCTVAVILARIQRRRASAGDDI